MSLKAVLVLVGLVTAISITTTQAEELESGHVGKFAAQSTVFRSLAQLGLHELTDVELDRVKGGQILPGDIPIIIFPVGIPAATAIGLSRLVIEVLRGERPREIRIPPGSLIPG